MAEQVSHAQILQAVAELRAEVRNDVGELRKEVSALNNQAATGKGALKALFWIGGAIISIATVIIAAVNVLRPH